jgi:RHS repeat-associated protein
MFTYDVLDRLIAANYTDSASSFVYDTVGRLIQATDSLGGTIVNEYDELNRLTAQITGQGEIEYAYDALDRRVSMHVAGQAPVAYVYDAKSRLTRITQGSQIVNFVYDAADRRTQLTLPNGVSTEYKYDIASQLTELIYRNASGVLGNLTYSYDSNGNRREVGGSFARTLLPDPIATATYDAAHRQRAFGNKTMNFDANGNLTSISASSGVTNFTWDSRNRLIAMNSPGAAASFTYDVSGRRTAKQINGQLARFLYDGADIVQEVTNGSSINLLRSLAIDELLVRNGNEYALADGLGSSIELTSQVGSLQTEYTYEPFGRTVVAGEASNNSFQYTGRENDRTGLYFYRARYYDPQAGRFISEDPIRFGGGDVNLYRYVLDDPISYQDPLGLWAGIDDAIFSGGGAIAGLAGQGLSDLLSGQLSGWEDYTGAAIGGAAFGETLLYAGPVLAGAVGGAVTNASKQGLKNLTGKQCGFNGVSFASDTLVGAATGLIPGVRVPGVTAGRGSWNAVYKQMSTKFANGQISNVTTSTALKMFGGRAVDTALVPGVAAGSLSGTYLEPYIPGYGNPMPCRK